MKRISNIFDKVTDINNIILADNKARKGKTNTFGVKIHDRNREVNLYKLQDDLSNLTYKTSKYHIFKIYEPKEREIYRLPYYPDRIAHHTLMNILEPIWEKVFISHSYACRKNKGIHNATRDIKKILKKDKENTEYCLKLDIRKFYPSINHDILKAIIRRKIKDSSLLNVLDGIIDSADGVPIGNYLSQYFANLYLTYFDHWVKEVKKVKYYFRYADDIVILHKDKNYLHKLCFEIKEYLQSNLKLHLKDNYQVFPLDSRGIDFVGYKFFHTHTLLRKNIKHKMFRTITKLNKYKRSKNYVRKKLCAYAGWLKFCNSINLCKHGFDELCNKFKLPTPEHCISKNSITSNILDKPIRIVDYKIYSNYFKLYVVTNKLLAVKSRSEGLFKILLHCFSPNIYYTIKRINNKYYII